MNSQPTSWEQVLKAVNNGQEPTAEQWQALTPDERELIDLLQQEKLTTHAVAMLDRIDEEKAWQSVSGQWQQPAPVRNMTGRRYLRYAAAVAGLLVLGTAAWLLLSKNRFEVPRSVVSGTYITEPLDPRRATLVLDDGRHIDLRQQGGSTIVQGQTAVHNIDTSLLRYTVANAEKPAPYNTLIIPRGGQYKIELADGTQVWLNAETKLRYPIHFGGVPRREVFLEGGEAYFEVKHNAGQPFIVHAGDMDVSVLGTGFNVNTYSRHFATTLVQGSVQLSAGDKTALLQPGEQGIYKQGAFTNRKVDVETYTAWKNGEMIYEEATLEEVMHMIGRQYDYTIEFTAPSLQQQQFGGRFRKTAQIEDMLAAIGKAGNIQFSIRDRTIYISPALSK